MLTVAACRQGKGQQGRATGESVTEGTLVGVIFRGEINAIYGLGVLRIDRGIGGGESGVLPALGRQAEDNIMQQKNRTVDKTYNEDQSFKLSLP